MITGEQMIENVKRDEIIACDWDGVIQDIDTHWLEKVIDNRKFFEPYFDFSKITNDKGVIDTSLILKRDKYYINAWLAKDNVEVPNEVVDAFIKLYMDDVLFYEECPALNMVNMLKGLIDQKVVKKVHFISSAPDGFDTDPRKIKKMHDLFEGYLDNMTLDIIGGHEKKSDFINKNIPEYTVFIDDRSDNVRDVIDNTDSSNKQFILPLYPYNVELGKDREYLKKLYNKGSIVTTYKNEYI